MRLNKTHKTHLRRIFIAYLLDRGIDTVPKIVKVTSMPRRTVQEVLKSLSDIEIMINHEAGGTYSITSWGAISKDWAHSNVEYMSASLDIDYVAISSLGFATERKQEH